MLKTDMGSEGMAPGLGLDVGAAKRFSSQQCIITLWLAKAWTGLLGQGHVNMGSKNKPKTKSHWKMPIIRLPAFKLRFHESAFPHNSITSTKTR